MIPLMPPARLGVVGGGQLGRMFALDARRMGYKVVALSPTADGPAAQVADEVVVGPPGDLRALREFASKVDAATVEFENVSAAGLRWLARRVPVRPGWKTVWTAQNRLREKVFLSRCGHRLAPWRPVRDEGELAAAVDELGTPLILKTAASGYDGRGQARVEEPAAAAPAWATLGRVACVAEAVVAFAAEVSVVVARGVDGAAVAYPLILNRHANHVLDCSACPAPVGPIVAQEAREMALDVADRLDTVGVLAVEFFLTAEGILSINELAPRPHNSAHLTIEAASTGQFEQQVRALCGLPLGVADLVAPAAAMVNLLGDLWVGGEPGWASMLSAVPEARLHLYGKRTPAPGRKMGHLTVLGTDPDAALDRARAARRAMLEGRSY